MNLRKLLYAGGNQQSDLGWLWSSKNHPHPGLRWGISLSSKLSKNGTVPMTEIWTPAPVNPSLNRLQGYGQCLLGTLPKSVRFSLYIQVHG